MQPTRWQIQLILAQKIIFCHLLKYLSKMDLSAVLTPALSDYHWLRRPLHGSLHRSCIAVVYPTLELICEFWPSKFSHYPSRPVPLPEVFVTTRPDPVPKSKTTTRQSLPATRWFDLGPVTFSLFTTFGLKVPDDVVVRSNNNIGLLQLQQRLLQQQYQC